MTKEDVRTIILPSGRVEIRPSTQNSEFDFGSVSLTPKRSDPRYQLSLRTLGHLEMLAKVRLILAEKLPELHPERLGQGDPDTVRSIVRSIFASDELGIGLHVHRDIKDTYFWVLNQQSEPVLTYDFLLEVHRRMFQSAKPKSAGQIKDGDVLVRSHRHDGVVVEALTVPAAQAEQFLRALCERTSQLFQLAQENADALMLLAAAEFACDFLAIHPFQDGNGRTARLLVTYLLERGGYHFAKICPFDVVVSDTREEYYEALNTSQRYWHTAKEDLSPWMEYFVEAVLKQCECALRVSRADTSKAALRALRELG